jgi:hypothetical protein
MILPCSFDLALLMYSISLLVIKVFGSGVARIGSIYLSFFLCSFLVLMTIIFINVYFKVVKVKGVGFW